MRRSLFTFLLIIMSWQVNAQKFGYIDSSVILEKMKDYQTAQQELDKAAEGWQKEIEEKSKELEALKRELIAEGVLMTPEMKATKEAELKEKETKLREFQRNVFGYEGMFFIKRQTLVDPLLDKINEAARKVAKKYGLGMLIDIAGDLVLVYAEKKYDYTDYVLEELELGDPVDTEK